MRQAHTEGPCEAPERAKVEISQEIHRDLDGAVLPSVGLVEVSVVPEGRSYGVRVRRLPQDH
ncbi:hypothetical protein STA1M1_19900 [Sinisalibacter aestuarii]|uniref:Uncharacterized protein n=1 Tax=Sinisalibacter aestuarii TaxID=2949426 RepID=A0ABQ5LV17_9RHOB|nr:hypothetical protein STA1M1_19900 [Sinisalibacter aestuarii]